MRQNHRDQNYCKMDQTITGKKLDDQNCRDKNYRKLKLAIDSLNVMSVRELNRKNQKNIYDHE